MKKYIVSFLFVMIASQSCKNDQIPLTTEEVINVIRQFDDGWRTKNLQKVDSVLSPLYVYFTQTGGLFSRDSVVATAGEATYALQSMSRSEIEITLSGNTAIASTRWKGKGTYRGTPFDEDQRCSIVVVKIGNTVEILSEHCTPIKAARIFH
ncbi:MAG TPA: DUF4440 domain-containing protein [Puia sp.]|jgi:hypothetical protein|nr:DUF4440 domain-containing protein [Puia sp.]